MGEYADMMLEGEACAGCGMTFPDGMAPGFPRYCSRACRIEAEMVDRPQDVACPGCGRLVRGQSALAQHRAAKGH